MNNLEDYKYPEFNEQFPGMIPKDGSGGSDIPTPTVEDEGKVLSVNSSGEYALTEASGGGSIECVITETEANVFSCNMTQAEIMSAMSNNANIHFVLSYLYGAKMFCVYALPQSKGVYLGFVNNNVAVGVLFLLVKIVGSSVTVLEKTIGD